jgi:hypothetical protein
MSTAVISSARPAGVHKLAATQFDYNTVPASIRFDLQAQAKLIKKLIAKTTADLIDLGRHLIAAKPKPKTTVCRFCRQRFFIDLPRPPLHLRSWIMLSARQTTA